MKPKKKNATANAWFGWWGCRGRLFRSDLAESEKEKKATVDWGQWDRVEHNCWKVEYVNVFFILMVKKEWISKKITNWVF